MINLENISLIKGNQSILDKVSLTVQQGEFTCIIGPPGSGKTALLKILSKKITPTDGAVEVPVEDTVTMPAVPENRELSIQDYLLSSRIIDKRIFSRFSHEDMAAVEKIIELFELEPYTHVPLKQVSVAILRRARCAFALAAPHSCLLLDSPVDGLDQKGKILFARSINWKLINHHATLLMATHDLNFALQYADRIIIMGKGTIAVDTNPDQVTSEIIEKHLGVQSVISRNIYNGRPELHLFPAL